MLTMYRLIRRFQVLGFDGLKTQRRGPKPSPVISALRVHLNGPRADASAVRLPDKPMDFSADCQRVESAVGLRSPYFTHLLRAVGDRLPLGPGSTDTQITDPAK